MPMLISRRILLRRSLQVSLGSLVAGMAGTAATADRVCADPKQMDGGQASTRKSLNYTETSPDQSKTCSICAFFQATDGGCGSCMIFNGPANSKGHCDSWAAKG